MGLNEQRKADLNRLTAFENLINRIHVPIEKKTDFAGAIKTSYLVGRSGNPIVLLHGGGAGAIAWYSVMDRLVGSFHVIAPDVVGYGESDMPSAAYDRPFFTRWLRDFLDAIGLRKSTLVAHSQGATIALQFTLENPDRVERLVLVSPAGLKRIFPFRLLLRAMWLYGFPSVFACQWMHSLLVSDPNHLDRSSIIYATEVCRRPGGNRVAWQGRGKSITPIALEDLERINQQTLIIWGYEDKIVSHKHGYIAKQRMPHAQLEIIPNAGHIPFFDQKESFCDLLLQFLVHDSAGQM
jgi:2-hydroxymuconate-semialdehyde hydrolase